MIPFTLMIQGTTSDAGKSTLVTALGRVLSRRGINVVPFKPQNMALNSAVTEDGGEIGRAQVVQAQACGLKPHTDMNPVLIKPNSDKRAQIIIHGKAIDDMDATVYHDYKKIALQAVMESYRRLQQNYDAVLVEGAGSPAEINLRENDIANMGFAEEADCPVIIIADIDRGGVFAHLVGTLQLLSQSEQERVKGFIINRFRGDIELLKPGLEWLEEKTGKPVLGVLPYLTGIHLEAEDAIYRTGGESNKDEAHKVIVPALPRISNHTDFDPLRLHPAVDFRFIAPDADIPAADLIIIPGTKSVRQDLQWLHEQGWVAAIQRHLRFGGKLIGICGGFQMLGKEINDPLGIEGEQGSSSGLGYLDMVTELKPGKALCNVEGELVLNSLPVSGYEIHSGITIGPALERPLVKLSDRSDGAISEDEQILGTYLHGAFDSSTACEGLLAWAGMKKQIKAPDYKSICEDGINQLADMVEEQMDIEQLMRLCSESVIRN